MSSWKNSTCKPRPTAQSRSGERDSREAVEVLTDEKRIKAVTVLFSDLEGRLHLLDYDKKFILSAHENLTFDGSRSAALRPRRESDLRLGIDWSAFYWVPADVFGNGKVLVFGTSSTRTEAPTPAICAACSRRMPRSSSRRTATR